MMTTQLRTLAWSMTLLGGLALAGRAEAAEWRENVLTLPLAEDGISGWRLAPPESVSMEPVKECLRLREIGPEGTGELQRRFSLLAADGSRYRFLQVVVNEIEDIDQGLAVIVRSEAGAVLETPAFPGVTTIDLAALPGGAEGRTVDVSLRVTGRPGTEVGGWMDLRDVILTTAPTEGLILELAQARTPGVAAVGDRLRVRFAAQGAPDDLPRVRFYLTDEMIPYRFAAGETLLTAHPDGGLATEIPLTGAAWRLVAAGETQRGALIASLTVGGSAHYAPAPFLFDLPTENPVPAAVMQAKTPAARDNRMLWLEYTEGENLALNRPVRFSATPDYGLTRRNGTDEQDLVDGKLSSRLDDRIWFSADAVGWYMHPTPTYNILIDLGEVQPVDRVVARFLGSHGGLSFPRSVEIAVSLDGRSFYRVAGLEKLQPGEKEQSDWESFYFLPEDTAAYVYPFRLSVGTQARYVGLTVTAQTGAVFSDEIAVIKGAAGLPAPDPGQLTEVPFITEGIVFRPSKSPLAITTNITTPNLFYVSDCRKGADAEKPVTYIVEVPGPVEILKPQPSNTVIHEPFQRDGHSWTRVHLIGLEATARRNRVQIPTFFLALAEDAVLPADAHAVFTTECEGVEANRFEIPIEAVAVPVVPPLKHLHISLSWTHEGQMINWPGFWEAWPALGYNVVSTFPRYWRDGTPSAEVVAFLAEARERGYGVIYNESPFHVMLNRRGKQQPEIFSQFADGTTGALCPSYQGEFYREEIQRVADLFAASNADYVFYDIECWYNGAREAGRCQRCLEAQKASGLEMGDYLATLGPRMWRDMRNAIAEKAAEMNRPLPVIGSYNNHAASPPHHMVMDFRAAYPESLDQAQPSLYVRGDARLVNRSIRANYEAIGKRDILPWLSAGTYGEFEPRLLEPMILEALINGACGITYYKLSDFDTPMDFYYQAKALAQIAPHEQLIMESEPCEVQTDNEALWVSGCRRTDEMLILVGNYDRAPNGRVAVELPFAAVTEVRDLRAGAALPAASPLRLNVPPGEIALVYVKGRTR